MATYREIQTFVKTKHGFVPKTCWIAHAKEVCGIPVKIAPNRSDSNERVNPCPDDKLPALREVFKYFGII